MRLLFFHGAGGYDDDRPLADDIGTSLSCPVDMPRLPDEDMSAAGWAAPIREHISGLGSDDVVIAHSFGASILLQVLSTGVPLSRAVLLAMPDWGPEGWDIAEYAVDGVESAVTLSLHHCRDDEVVPFAHLALHADRLPSARIVHHAVGGHQFRGLAEVIAADALSLKLQ